MRAQTFQPLMDEVGQCLDFIYIYFYDVFIFSKTPEEHVDNVGHLAKRFQDSDLVINLDKCLFGQKVIDFFGYRISMSSVTTLPDEPTSTKKLQEFIGLINFYHSFIQNMAKTMQPLYSALKDKVRCRELNWKPATEQAFIDAKRTLANETALTFMKAGALLALSTDASLTEIGAVLEKFVDGTCQPLSFFSS
ncbi:Transposon Ty3-G Gag-Pol polyprotein [Thelohanellus kitauei]|uniref:Transposon Ty3-G Gag-Pol polyprotein n=1 Tax=Thelohanellus kitauei TaxID=669202 RepID=A0A0C2JR05_THEKT|nr:Transposon Ty3-G Gag-Pol polyprotein [Thelohanellus kitauei]